MLWGAFFLWPILSGRSSGRRSDSIGDFSYRLGVIGKTGGHRGRRREAQPPAIAVAMPPSIPPARPLGAPGAPGAPALQRMAIPRPVAMSRSQRRRRDVLVILGVGVVSSLLLAVFAGNPVFWLVQLFMDVLLVSYLALLVRMKQTANERQAKVRYLPAPPQHANSLVLRRSSVSS